MEPEKLQEILNERFEDENVEITQKMAESYLKNIDETAIESDVGATITHTEVTGDQATELMNSHGKDKDSVDKIENGDSELYLFFDDYEDAQSVIDETKTELKQFRVNSEIVSRASGMVPIPPEPNEAKERLLTKAENPESDGGWGWSRSKVRTLRTDHALMFDFIEAGNYPEAKNEADHAYDNGTITQSQRDWIHDMLDGVV